MLRDLLSIYRSVLLIETKQAPKCFDPGANAKPGAERRENYRVLRTRVKDAGKESATRGAMGAVLVQEVIPMKRGWVT